MLTAAKGRQGDRKKIKETPDVPVDDYVDANDD